MDNLQVLSRLCNAIANTFYPDIRTLELMLFNEGIQAQAEAKPRDPEIFRLAARLVRGYVESSRNENGISLSVREDAIEENLRYWCEYYGLDAELELGDDGQRVIKDGTNMW